MTIRRITNEELKNDIITKKNFPDAIFMNSSSFFNEYSKYLGENSIWIGLFGGKSDKTLLSVINITVENSKSIRVDLLETRKGYRKKGYASKLLKFVEGAYLPGTVFNLVVVNKNRIKFYKNLGYYETSSNDAATHMQKTLKN